jgi:branched-chain amino acid transport system permease protein
MAMRAISWDKTFVPLMGIPVDLIISVTFAIGAGLAGAAGTMYALAYPVIDPYMGIMVGWKAFISAVVGGIGNIRGAMIGAFILGWGRDYGGGLLPVHLPRFRGLRPVVVLIDRRPYGILGSATDTKSMKRRLSEKLRDWLAAQRWLLPVLMRSASVWPSPFPNTICSISTSSW